MFIVTAVVSLVLAAALAGSAYAKLTKNPQVVESIVHTVGFPEERMWVLAGLEVAAVAGLVIGLFWAPIGIAAAIGVVLYFIAAVGGHLRAGDTKPAGFGPAAFFLLLGVAALVLRTLTA